MAIQGPRQLRGTLCGLCGCRSKRASEGTVLTFARRGGRGWLRTRQVKKTVPADIRPAPTQARHDIVYFLISEWTGLLGFTEGLHSSRHPLKQQEPRGCGNLWRGGGVCCSGRRMRTLFLNSPRGGPSWAQPVKKSNRSSARALRALLRATRSSRAPGFAGQVVQVKPLRRSLEGGGEGVFPQGYPPVFHHRTLLPGTCISRDPARSCSWWGIKILHVQAQPKKKKLISVVEKLEDLDK